MMKPKVGVHCFSSGFFKLIEHRNGGVYDYEESVGASVRNQFNRYEHGIASLKQLLAPINKMHWTVRLVGKEPWK